MYSRSSEQVYCAATVVSGTRRYICIYYIPIITIYNTNACMKIVYSE